MREFFRQQYQNLFLWSPFVMAFGAALYFILPFEPNIAYPILISVLSLMIIIIRKPNAVLTGILLFIFGFFYSAGFTRLINTPQLSHSVREKEINGTVTNIDYTNDKSRIFIKTSDLIKNKNSVIRVSTDANQNIPDIGDNIKATVTLFKPSGPDAPNSFDYARWAYFNKITATGYLNNFTVTQNNNNKIGNINKLRNYLHSQTNSVLADTLVLGYKKSIPATELKIWTAAGIGHVWSISGFHITLVGGWLFVLFYLIFRSIAPITSRIPARYPAIIFSWFGLLFYLFLSGIDVATIRAFLMASLFFIAFIFGRNAFSLRNVCIAFMAIFLINPHYIMQPGFQLSFSAIFGLIWFFNNKVYKKISFGQKILRIIRITIMTSIIATLFTAPFVASNFYSIPIYSLIGNLILLPIFSLLVMPLVIIGTILSLFGIMTPLIWSCDIYNFTFNIANKIAQLPFAKIDIPSIPNTALFLIIIGFLCLMFVINYNKIKYNLILFITFVTAGIIIITVNPKPLFYSTSDHELIGFVKNGKLEFNKKSASNHYFAFDSWKHLNFEKVETENKRRKCKDGVCIFKTPNWTLAYAQKYVPTAKNIVDFCNDSKIDFILSYFDIESKKCNHKILRGGFIIYKSGQIIHTTSNRWWNNQS